MQTRNLALTLMSLAILSTGCARTEVVERPVPVEVVKYEQVPVPADLLSPIPPQVVPDALSFAQALELWIEDREAIERLNGRLRAIQELQ